MNKQSIDEADPHHTQGVRPVINVPLKKQIPIRKAMQPRRSTSLFSLGLAASLTTTAAAVTFERDVLPLFEKHCLECHGGDATEADPEIRARS
jgi:hypothetical protein